MRLASAALLTLAACAPAREPPPGVFLAGEATVEGYEAIKALARKTDVDKAAFFDAPTDGAKVSGPLELAWHMQAEPAAGWSFLLDVRTLGDPLLEIVTDAPRYFVEPEPWSEMVAAQANIEICAVSAKLAEDGAVTSGPFAGSWVTFSIVEP